VVAEHGEAQFGDVIRVLRRGHRRELSSFSGISGSCWDFACLREFPGFEDVLPLDRSKTVSKSTGRATFQRTE
jgi:hypothetical protein